MGNRKKCSGVLCVRKMPVKLTGNICANKISGKASIAVWDRDTGDDESPRQETGGE